jgi:hypothetical protein
VFKPRWFKAIIHDFLAPALQRLHKAAFQSFDRVAIREKFPAGVMISVGV